MVNRISPRLLLVLISICFAGFSASAQERETTEVETPHGKNPGVAVAQAEPQAAVGKGASGNDKAETGVLELAWEDLIPPGYSPYEIFEKYDIDTLDDSDPQAVQLMAELREAWSMAPVVKELDGKYVKLPGFVVPLEHEGEKVSEFLLVPYFGACIHVPPPPANQTVYVVLGKKDAVERKLFDTVWVTGTMSAKWTGNELGDAGYTLRASQVTPYEEE